MIVVAGTIAVRPERRSEAVRLIQQVVAQTKPETGCISYDFSVDLADDCLFRIFEQWDTPADLERHLGEPHTQTFLSAISALVAAAPDVRKYSVAAVSGL